MQKLSEDRFKRAEPFPHFVIDEFYPPPIAKAIAVELERMSLSLMEHDDHVDQVNKHWQQDVDRVPGAVRECMEEFNDISFRHFLERATGIGALKADHGFLGGGVHIHTTGGRLGVHVDFNRHPTTGLHRRLNLLCFFNEGWEPEWGGQLELWSKVRCWCVSDNIPPIRTGACPLCKGLGWRPKECVTSIDPISNRAVLLATTDYAFHAVAPITCPPERRRASLAFYYYSETRPPGEASDTFHESIWPEVAS